MGDGSDEYQNGTRVTGQEIAKIDGNEKQNLEPQRTQRNTQANPTADNTDQGVATAICTGAPSQLHQEHRAFKAGRLSSGVERRDKTNFYS
jgi:hypothetical protein